MITKQFNQFISWPGISLLFLFSLIILPSYSQDSGFRETPQDGRPPSVYSLCCCKKDDESNSRIFYKCGYVEEAECPKHSQQYKVNGFECPSTLIFKK